MSLLLAKNRGALHDHTIIEKYVAGIALRGDEVKAVREKKVSFEGTYVQLFEGRPCVVNMHIGTYSKKGRPSGLGDEKRNRDLLLNANEIEEIRKELTQKGRTAVPLALVMNNNYIKLEFAVVKGKKEYEKKQTAKDRQIQKDLERDTKEIKRIIEA
ncbi:SsrA-binding protein SmpB [candidate division WWE3 bacterium]|jgi:SsrA-binding protein|uniref:SsrA-binding protein n=1 Tax=candidate division WWE3 bacterium TaxID=2053526 RepID=A0A3A4ZJJ9_UNCKA|nr:MAG: SsrA-binding protein SmpB [candidate division WWE3 bacterium]